jgi:hypothetical protein
MSEGRAARIAAVQATPVILDAEAFVPTWRRWLSRVLALPGRR